MVYNFNKTCSSHMPILMEFIEEFKPRKVLEIGSGMFSTNLFLKYCGKIKSIEVANKIWFNFLRKNLRLDERINHVFVDDYKIAINNILGTYKLIFIDCCNPRHQIINHCFKHSKTIICHDTQLHWTKKIKIPEEFEEIKFTQYPVKYKNHRRDAFADRPWTTLFTADEKVYNHFMGIHEIELYEKYKFPYGVSK